MMWTVVAGEAAVIKLAQQWSGQGLLGESLWVDQADLAITDGTAATDIVAEHLPSGRRVEVLSFLADRLDVDEVCLIWCRREASGPAADRHLGQMSRMHEHLASHITGFVRFDLVEPQAAPLAAVASPVGWETWVVAAENAMTPGGIDLPTDDATLRLLHMACSVGGLLGGNLPHPLVVADATGAQTTSCANAFSSVVVGGELLSRATAEFIDVDLPDAAGLDLRPKCHTDELTGAVLDQAFQHLRRDDYDNRPICYRRPAAGYFVESERIEIAEYYRRVSAFVEFLFLRSKPVSWAEDIRRSIAAKLQSEDLGAQVELPAAEPTAVAPDLAAADAQLVEWINHAWEWECTFEHGYHPLSKVWRDLARLATSLVDGGPVPTDFVLPERDGRVPSVPLDQIQAMPSQLDGVQDDSEESWRDNTGGYSHSVMRERTAQHAGHLAMQSLRRREPLLVGTGQSGSRVTDRLAERSAELNDDICDQQAENLEPDAEAASHMPLLERLRSAVLADMISSALDSERNHQVATGPLGQITGLRAATFWFLIGGGLLASAAMIVGVALGSNSLVSWLAGLGLSVSTPALWATTAALSTALVVGPIFSYYRAYHAYVERGTRQIQARKMLFERALTSHREYLRLRHADRILGQWCLIFEKLFPSVEESSATPHSEEKPRLPHGLQLGVLAYDERQLRHWLIQQAAPVGWRGRALQAMAGHHLREEHGLLEPDEAIGSLAESLGLPGDPLHTLSRDVEQEWEQYRGAQIPKVSKEIKRLALGETDEVSTSAGLLGVTEFGRRLTVASYSPGRRYENPINPDPVTPKAVDLGLDHADLNEQICGSTTRLYVRPLRFAEVGADHPLPTDPDLEVAP